MILIKIFLILISFLVLILLALLFVPLPYSMSLCLDQNKAELRVNTLWLVTVQFSSANQATVSLAGRKLRMKPGKPQPSSSPSTGSERQAGNWRSYLNRELYSQAWSMLRAVLKHVLPQKIMMRGRIGLDDPYLTGLLFIFLPLLERIPGGDINLEPVWDDWNHELVAIASGRIIIIVLVYYALRFFFSPIFRRIRREQKQKVKPKCNPGLAGNV